jgi:hypothetical protein
LESPIPNQESIVLNAAKSGWQREMLKRRAYCPQISRLRHFLVGHSLQIKSSRRTKDNLNSHQSFIFAIGATPQSGVGV